MLDCTEDIGCLIEPRHDHIEEKTLRLVESQLGFPFGFLGHNCWTFDFHSEKKENLGIKSIRAFVNLAFGF